MRRRTCRLRGNHEVGRVVSIRLLPSQLADIQAADKAELESRGHYGVAPNVSDFVRRAALQAASVVLRSPAARAERHTFDGRGRRART
jgi:hypothetical protein